MNRLDVLDAVRERILEVSGSTIPSLDVSVVRDGMSSTPSHVRVFWRDGPSVPALEALLAPLGTVTTIMSVEGVGSWESTSSLLRFSRDYSVRSFCVGFCLLSASGEDLSLPEFYGLAPGLLTSDVLDDAPEWLEDSLYDYSSQLTSQVVRVLDPVDFSLRSDRCVTPARVDEELLEVFERLALDAGMGEHDELLLWAASGGYAAARDLVSP